MDENQSGGLDAPEVHEFLNGAQPPQSVQQLAEPNPMPQVQAEMPTNVPTLRDRIPTSIVPAYDSLVEQANQALDFDANLRRTNDIITAAAAGDPKAQDDLINHHVNLAMGSLNNVGTGLIKNIARPGFIDKALDSKVIMDVIGDLTKKGGATQRELALATQKAGREISKLQRLKKPLAKGGEVMMAEGGEISLDSPEVDSFLSVSPTQSPSASPLDSPEVGDYLKEELTQEKYGSPTQQAIAGVEGLAKGVAGPLATLAETSLGVNPEDIRGREEANPVTHFGTEAAGLLGSMVGGVGLGSMSLKAGEAASKLFGLKGAESLAGRLAEPAVRAAIENVVISAGDETSKMIMNDPNQSAQTALVDVGLAGLLGAGIGGALGAPSALWREAGGGKLGQIAEDFKGRLADRVSGVNSTENVTDELNNYYRNIKDVSDNVYGPQGLKAQDIAKAMPEMSEAISTQANEITDKLGERINSMIESPEIYPARLSNKLKGDLDNYLSKVTSPEASSADYFNAAQDLKQSLQGYAKFDKFVKPVDEAYDFVRDAKELAHDLRNSLEDKDVWGKAAERQQVINKAFKEYLPALEDFEKKFTTEIAGERVIDPGKVNTYMNQLDKPNADIKKTMLDNFLKSSEKYSDVIEKTHANLGLESPIVKSPLHSVRETLSDRSVGSKLADYLYDKGFGEVGGHGIGAAVGAGLGLPTGHGTLGAIIGERALGHFFASTLPALVKPIVESVSNSEALQSAINYSTSVARGEKIIDKAVKNIFTTARELMPEYLKPTQNDRNKIDKALREAQANPEKLLNVSNTGHYLPQHNAALGQVAGRTVNYLNSLRPDDSRHAPLDKPFVPNTIQKSNFQRALDIAQQPLTVLEKIKSGTLTPQDVKVFQNLYPDLYPKLVNKMVAQITNHISKGNDVPYSTRMSMSLFAAQPLDSTMTPQSIISAQPKPKQEQQGQATQPKHSTSKLGKVNQLYQTPLQSAAERRVLKD